MPKQKEEAITQKELQEALESYGRKLGFLISVLNIRDEAKEAMLGMIPHMSLKQIERLLNILEAGYLREQNKKGEGLFVSHLKEIKEEMDEKKEKLNKATLREVRKLARSVKK